MLSTLFYIIYHFVLKAPNVNKPFSSEGISLRLGIVGDEIMNPKIMDSSTPILTKTEGARDISAYTATQSTICGVGENVDTFPRTTHRCAERAYVTTCSTIDICRNGYTTGCEWWKTPWTTSLPCRTGGSK
jgi:hypothetical protein